MTTAILEILGSLLGMAASWYIGTQIVRWLGAWKRQADTTAIADDKKNVQSENQSQNATNQAAQKIRDDFLNKP